MGVGVFEVSRKKTPAAQKKPAAGVTGSFGMDAVKTAGDAAARASDTVPRDGKADIASIGAAVTVRGDITGRGDLVISGRVKGSVDLPDNEADIEATGVMEGGILANNVNVRGNVQGDIQARRKVTIFATGKVTGTIVAPRLEIEDGARFNGRIEMSEAGSAEAISAPAPKHGKTPASAGKGPVPAGKGPASAGKGPAPAAESRPSKSRAALG